jgi:hypothetical protein
MRSAAAVAALEVCGFGMRTENVRGLTRTETRRAASAVARPPISRQVRLRLNRPRRQRELENAKLTPMPLRWLPRLQILSRAQGRKITSLGNDHRAADRQLGEQDRDRGDIGRDITVLIRS